MNPYSIALTPFHSGTHRLSEPWRPEPGRYNLSGVTLEYAHGPATDLSGCKNVYIVSGSVAGYISDEDTANCRFSKSRFFGDFESQHFGGNRFTQTGGMNHLESCRFDGASLMVAGVSPMVNDCTFRKTPRHAIRFGLLKWDRPHVWGASNALISNCRFEECFTTASEDEDYGVLIAMRDWTQSIRIREPRFVRCKARALYLDDGVSNVQATGVKFWDCDRDFWIGGGRHIILEAESHGSAYPSRWDNRFCADKPDEHFDARKHLEPGRTFAVLHDYIKDCPAWLATVPNYLNDYENRLSWTSCGSLTYRTDGPEPDAFGGPEVAWKVETVPGLTGT